MDTQQSAQGLASLGRGNDSMLVHMTPNEVKGLQSLAMAHGGSLTINPQTGLPEAGFLDVVFPVVGSFFGIPPWLTASVMAGKTLIEGGDIGSAALSAFGGYTGGKLGESLKSFIDPIQKLPTSAINAAANTAKTTGNFIGSTGEMGSKLLSPTGGASQMGSNLGSVANEFGVNRPVEDVFKESFKPDFGKSNFVPGFADNNLQGSFMGKGFSQPGMHQAGGINTGYAYDTAAKVAEPNMFSSISEPISEGVSELGSQFGAAVKNPVDFARHVGEGDALMGGAKIGMYAASPLIEDMLQPPEFNIDRSEAERYDPNRRLNLSNDTGLRLLPNLNQPIRAAQGGAIKSYASGGTITTGGLRDLYGTTDAPSNTQLSRDGFGIGRLNNLAGEQSMYQAQTLGYAEGGDVSNYRQDQAALNLADQPTLNLNTGLQMRGDVPDFQRLFQRAAAENPNQGLLKLFSMIPHNAWKVSKNAKGGYLDGAGDGMSDSIPATIEGKQPARLADGEFVIPADVVSHLGNGSSKAGSKRLYAMLDKVRHARTGNKKQGKQIKPEKYMPKVA